MKKIIFLFILVFSFSINSNAQTQKATTETVSNSNISNDIEEFATITKITAEQKNNLINLIKMRDADILKARTTEEKRIIFNRYMDSYFAGISEEQKKALIDTNLALAKRITTFVEK